MPMVFPGHKAHNWGLLVIHKLNQEDNIFEVQTQ